MIQPLASKTYPSSTVLRPHWHGMGNRTRALTVLRNSFRVCQSRNMTCSLSIAILYQVCFATTPLHFNCLLLLFFITGSQPPSLLVTVSGNVQHGRGPAGNPVATPAKSTDGQSRVFSQTFMLVPDPTAPPTKTGEVAKYYVNADAMRFVGWIYTNYMRCAIWYVVLLTKCCSCTSVTRSADFVRQQEQAKTHGCKCNKPHPFTMSIICCIDNGP